jgi:hypothetical protein
MMKSLRGRRRKAPGERKTPPEREVPESLARLARHRTPPLFLGHRLAAAGLVLAAVAIAAVALAG